MNIFKVNDQIEFYEFPSNNDAVFSILIPSWNNFPYLKLLIESILEHSTFTHQICVHLNESCQKSIELLESKKISYSVSISNTGVCFGFNAAAAM
ncbi:MAG: hypothetical protein WAU01_10350, partial [Saprospiraceae bacterium]